MTEPSEKGLAAMDTESKGSRAVGEVALERAIVLQLLRDDRERMWSRVQLRTELDTEESKIGHEAVEGALQRLRQEGVLACTEEAVWASSAARRLDELGLIGV
jgi:predicted RNA-binding protein (virulence factor B family)